MTDDTQAAEHIPMTPATDDPIEKFRGWLAEAEAKEINNHNAMSLATATADGHPSVRMVLLKDVDARGFVFYTNLESRKGGELAENPHAALCFHWKSLDRQVRVEGAVQPVVDPGEDVGVRRPRARRRAEPQARAPRQQLDAVERPALVADAPPS